MSVGRCRHRGSKPDDGVAELVGRVEQRLIRGERNRVLHRYAVTGCRVQPGPGDLDVVICFDEFAPLNLQPYPAGSTAT